MTPTPRPLPAADDDAARQLIRGSLDRSFIVEAAAGTGKTHELVQRMVRVLAAGAKVSQIAAVTFTHKAAGELKLRLRQEIDAARNATAEDAERANLEDALARLEEAAVGTIHAFCAVLLRARPVEAVVDPAFEELSAPESNALFARVFREWFEARLATDSPVLRRALTRLAHHSLQQSSSPREQLQRAAQSLVEWRDYPTPWRRDPGFPREREIYAMVESLRSVAVQPAVAEIVGQLDFWDLDELETQLVHLPFQLPWALRENPRGAFRKVLDDLNRFIEVVNADFVPLLRDELMDAVRLYDRRKHQAGKLDFLDLVIRTRDLLRDNATVRAECQRQFSHLFVDEFQDTDPLQMEILLLLAAEDPAEADWRKAKPAAGKLFVVGDPKQSIYKFRRADVVVYEDICRTLETHGVERIHLTRSRRSVPAIQQLVNAAFEPVIQFDAEAGQPRYVPLAPFRRPLGAQPGVVVIPAPAPYNVRNVTKGRINECLPDALVAFVEWLIRSSGWKVSNPDHPEGDPVALEPRHICLLFRRFVDYKADVTSGYVRSLEARGIPHMLIGSKSFHRRDEVETLRAALTAIEWPDDDLAVFATLHGSLFAFDDGLLLRYREEVGPLLPFRKRPEDLEGGLGEIGRVLDQLAGLHRARNRKPIASTLVELLDFARAHAGFAFRPSGEQVLANVYRVCDLARNFERSGGLSFRGFVEEMTAQSERHESAEPPVFEDSAAGVRLMTLHGAKGLEFPVVVLCDMTAGICREPERYLDSSRNLCATRLLKCAPAELIENLDLERKREHAEGVRVAYVAATRARDLLVIPAVGDGPQPGWLEPLNPAIYPPQGRERHARPAPPGCPRFGEASVLKRPWQFDGKPEMSVKPGLHRPQVGSHEVVWWDPAALNLGVEENFGVRQQEVLSPGGADVAAQIAEYRAWQAAREERNRKGAVPSLRVSAVKESGAAPKKYGVTSEAVTRKPGRPAGAQFGTLVHALLHHVPLDASRAEIERYALVQARLGNRPDEERNAAIEAVEAALAHPAIAAARQAEAVHREWTLVLPLAESESTVVIEGEIDLAYLGVDGVWTVVDYKTDADPNARAAYEEQLRWYCYAVERITGQPARAVLLAV